MKRHWLIAATLLFMVVPLSADLRADEEVTIMAVGDSITQGGSSFRCYREFLIPMLSKAETKVRFVGPNRDQFSAHSGYGGKNTSFLSGIIGNVYSKHPADIVLLHSGHNSFSKDKPVPGLTRATEQMVDTIHELNPDVTILLAQVIPSGKDCRWFALGPVAVSPSRQRQGIGQALVNGGLESIRKLGANGCVLVGEPALYSRFGFRHDPALQMEGVPPEVLLCLPMCDETPEGSVQHHPAFSVGM